MTCTFEQFQNTRREIRAVEEPKEFAKIQDSGVVNLCDSERIDAFHQYAGGHIITEQTVTALSFSDWYYGSGREGPLDIGAKCYHLEADREYTYVPLTDDNRALLERTLYQWVLSESPSCLSVNRPEGFEEWQTGGGCTAWGKNVLGEDYPDKEEVAYILLTCPEGGGSPDSYPLLAGLYGSGDGDEIAHKLIKNEGELTEWIHSDNIQRLAADAGAFHGHWGWFERSDRQVAAERDWRCWKLYGQLWASRQPD